MARRPVLTFDCYGTLIDWESGISRAVAAAAEARGLALERREILDLHASIEPRVEAGTYRRYREVLAETARRLLAVKGLDLALDDCAFLPDSLPGWPPFPDTRGALERLAAAGYRLGILSNVDDDLLAATRRRLGVEFDVELVVTAQQVESYKPAPGHFHEARRRIGDAPWTHVAQSLFHDVAPATRLGIPVVWIDRRRETPPASLARVPRFDSLERFADERLTAT